MADPRGVFTLGTISDTKIPLGQWVDSSTVWISQTAPNTGNAVGGASAANQFTTVDKISYSIDTVSLSSATLSPGISRFGGEGSSSAGYFGGGTTGTPFYSTMYKLTYLSDAITTVPTAGSLSAARYGLAATGSSAVGYFGGGQTASNRQWTTMDKLTYSTETTAVTPSANLIAGPGLSYLGATGSTTAGYFGGGFNAPASSFSTIHKLVYSTDVTTALPATGALSVARWGITATGSFTAGYFSGGSGPITTTDKITYSTDTMTAVPNAFLILNRYAMGSTGNINFGYFFGGRGPSTSAVYSTVDKITYSSDTLVTLPATLSAGRSYSSGLSARANALPQPIISTLPATRLIDSTSSTPNTGYFSGGISPATVSTIDKVTYSSDTTTAVPGAALSAARAYLSATGSSTAGYFGGGASPGPLYYSTMDKMTYSTDTRTTVPSASLSTTRTTAATGSSTAGYFGGGFVFPATPGYFSTMDKLTYGVDTTAATPSAALSIARTNFAATGSSTAGYFGGGAAAPVYSTMDKITYSSDTTAATPSASLSVGRYALAASSARANSLPYIDNTTLFSTPSVSASFSSPSSAATPNTGYFGGGTTGVPTYVTTMDKVTYSTDTRLVIPTASLSASRYQIAATGSSTAGYFAGGAPGPVSTMDKTTYSTDTTSATPSAVLNTARSVFGATGSSTAGYFGGGISPGLLATIEKTTYSTDTTALIPATLSSTRQGPGATGSSAAGYFGGGFTISTIDKLTYSTDTTAATPSANLSTNRGYLAATSSSTAGYFGGGTIPGATAIVDKVNYSSDTLSLIPGAGLTIARQNLAATGSSDAGYFGGGASTNAASPFYSTTDKISYSTDTTAASPGAALSNARYGVAASSAQANSLPITSIVPQTTTLASFTSAAYFAGGGSPGSPNYAFVDKIPYSNDTRTTLPSSGSLSLARYGLTATGSSTAGYFGGGKSGVYPYSIMDKTTYSTDTTALLPGAALSAARYGLTATGSTTAGYFGGGGSSGSRSVDKLTYSTDTTAASPSASLSAVRYNMGASSSPTAGYFGGGDPSYLSIIDRINYVDDTRTTLPSGLTIGKSGLTATGSTLAGYFGGGSVSTIPNLSSSVDKLTYSSETPSITPSAALGTASLYKSATTTTGLTNSLPTFSSIV